MDRERILAFIAFLKARMAEIEDRLVLLEYYLDFGPDEPYVRI
jgi:hypothetical protein